MKKANQFIREIMFKNDITQWQLAQAMGVCELTVNRMLRVELSTDNRFKVLDAIERIQKERENN